MDGAVVDVDMCSLKKAAESGGSGYVTEITRHVFPQDLRTGRSKIIGAT